MRQRVQYAALAVGTLCALVMLSTFMPGAPLVPTIGVVVVVGSAVPVLIGLLILLKGRPIKVRGLAQLWLVLRKSLPQWGIGLAALAFYGAWIVAGITMVSGTAGNLKEQNGVYTTQHRKVVTTLTRDQYYEAMAKNHRIFSAIGLAFCTSAFVLSGLTPALERRD